MRSIVVCQTHSGLLEIGTYPTAYYDEAIKQGWQVTNHPLFSYGGKEVWICPECVRWLEDYLIRGPMWQAARGLFFVWQADDILSIM